MTQRPIPPESEPWSDAESQELDALEARVEPRVDELLATMADLFPAAVIDEMKESLVSFAVTHPTMVRMLKRVGPPPVVEESGTVSTGERVVTKQEPSSKRSRGSK